MYAEPRTQDSQGGPDEEDEDGDEQGSVHSSREEPEEVLEGEEMLPWRGPGQCAACFVATTNPFYIHCKINTAQYKHLNVIKPCYS